MFQPLIHLSTVYIILRHIYSSIHKILAYSLLVPKDLPKSVKHSVLFFSEVCSVIEKKSKEFKPCILPFRHNGETYNNCTEVSDPEKKPWCSTKVDQLGNHVRSGGYWGHCNEDCNKNVQQQTELPPIPGLEGKSLFKYIIMPTVELKSAYERIVLVLGISHIVATL